MRPSIRGNMEPVTFVLNYVRAAGRKTQPVLTTNKALTWTLYGLMQSNNMQHMRRFSSSGAPSNSLLFSVHAAPFRLAGAFCRFSTVQRIIGFLGGWGIAYAFCNPDADVFFDVMPHHARRPFAFITPFKVKDGHSDAFVKDFKRLARYFQKQPGYLFTRLDKAERQAGYLTSQSSYDYINTQEWLNRDAMYNAAETTEGLVLIRRVEAHLVNGTYNPHFYAVVADDRDNRFCNS